MISIHTHAYLITTFITMTKYLIFLSLTKRLYKSSNFYIELYLLFPLGFQDFWPKRVACYSTATWSEVVSS